MPTLHPLRQAWVPQNYIWGKVELRGRVTLVIESPQMITPTSFILAPAVCSANDHYFVFP